MARVQSVPGRECGWQRGWRKAPQPSQALGLGQSAGRQGRGPPWCSVGSTVREGGVFCFPGTGEKEGCPGAVPLDAGSAWGFFMGQQGAWNQRPGRRVCEHSRLLMERRKLLEVCQADAGWAPYPTPCPGQSAALAPARTKEWGSGTECLALVQNENTGPLHPDLLRISR